MRLLSRSPGWQLVYGRRKTGKTFLVRQFVPHDAYYFVKRDRTILAQRNDQPPEAVGYEAFLEILWRDLAAGRVLVVDEFHRLEPDFLDRLHAMEKIGRLILVSSTLSFSRNLLESRSPLLGLVQEVPVPLVDLEDALRVAAREDAQKKDSLENAVLLQEPMTSDLVVPQKGGRDNWRSAFESTIRTIPALVGEVFTEERRRVTATYEGILRAIAIGHNRSGEITGHLFSRRLIAKQDPSVIQTYLNSLVNLGILTKIRVYNKNRFIYRHRSPLSQLFYYADERYNISERQTTHQEIDRIVQEVLPRTVEDCIRTALARKFGLEEAIVETRDHEVDVCLLRFDKPEIMVEVKWKKTITKGDLHRAETTLANYPDSRCALFVPDRAKVPETHLEILDVGDLLP